MTLFPGPGHLSTECKALDIISKVTGAVSRHINIL